MANLNVAVDKLIRMHHYISQLQSLKPSTYEDYKADHKTRYAVERVMQLIVDLALDVNNILLAHRGRPPASDYFNSFIDLAECGILTPEFALEIAPSTGLRNRLVHEYEVIKDSIVYDSVDLMVEMYSRYIVLVNELIIV